MEIIISNIEQSELDYLAEILPKIGYRIEKVTNWHEEITVIETSFQKIVELVKFVTENTDNAEFEVVI